MPTLLLVDDDENFLEFISQTLIPEGYDILKANDGIQAQEILKIPNQNIASVILDWNMPRMDGIELLKWIRQQDHLEAVQVIMQTANDNPEYIREGIEAGAFYYLIKPCKREMLLSTIKSAVTDYLHQVQLLKKLHDSENSFRLLEEGIFKFKTISEGEFLATRIANVSSSPEDAMYVSELFANAVEHGNLGISYDEKTRLIDAGTLQEEVNKRLASPEYIDRYVKVSIKNNFEEIEVFIEDQGMGFNYDKYLNFDDKRIFDNHGRGIAICNSYLKLQYLEKGNKVLVKLPGKSQHN
jgi:DNA-binding response OmpR family regulator